MKAVVKGKIKQKERMLTIVVVRDQNLNYVLFIDSKKIGVYATKKEAMQFYKNLLRVLN